VLRTECSNRAVNYVNGVTDHSTIAEHFVTFFTGLYSEYCIW